MLRDYDRGRYTRRCRQGTSNFQIRIRMKNHAGGYRGAPQNIDLIVLSRGITSDTRTVGGKCRVLMQMHRHGHGFVFEVFAGMNVVKRCL